MKWTPHKYQLDAVKFLVSKGSAGLLLDPGLGKTAITLAAFKTLKKAGIVNRMLVIAPLRPAYSVWPKEVRKWDDFGNLSVNVLHGPSKTEKLAAEADMDIINPEGLPWLLKAVGKGPWPWEMLVVDESTRFKHTNTQRFKTLRPALDRFSRRVILTGSPAPNGLLDLFGQIYILDLGNALGRFITHYRISYFDSTGYGGYTYVPRPGAAELIQERISPLVMRLSAADHLDLPPLTFNEVEVELPGPARKLYDQMEDTLLAALGDELVTAANVAVATGKCRQIANGGLFHDGGEKWSHIHDAKTDAVEEIVEELQGRPALVAYEFKHDLERLRARFPNAPFIGGGVPPQRFREIEEGWNAGLIPVLLAQPQSVAHGLNLQGVGAAVIFHSQTWDLEVEEQFIRRVWRQGQKEAVIVHKIKAVNTVDEAIIKSLEKKDHTQRSLLEALKTHLRRSR